MAVMELYSWLWKKDGTNEIFTVWKSPHCTCYLCQEVVFQKKSLSGRRFGVLQNCNHIFCVRCIQEHIKKNIEFNKIKHEYKVEELLRRSIICPVCKLPSSVVMTSEKSLLDAKERKIYKKVFDKFLCNIPCPFVKRGITECFCKTKHEFPEQ